MTSKSAKSANQTSFAATETPGTLHSLLVASGSPPPSAIVYAVPEFICWGMPVEIKVRMQTARLHTCDTGRDRRPVSPTRPPAMPANRKGESP